MTKARDLANAADVLDDVSATELSYVNGVTSAIQTQLNAKQAVVSGVDDTEIGYLNGVTSAIQTQIDSKIGSASAISPTLIDAKGDLIVGSAADTAARLAVGTNNHVLTADSSATNGVKWAAVASGPTFVGAIVKKSDGSNQSIDNNTLTAITWDAEDFDTDAFHSTSSNTSRFTIPSGKAGKYQLVLHGNIEQDATGRRAIRLYKNGESFQRGVTFLPTSGDGIGIQYFDYSAVMNLAVDDYIEIYFFQNSGSNKNWYAGSNSACAFYYLGA